MRVMRFSRISLTVSRPDASRRWQRSCRAPARLHRRPAAKAAALPAGVGGDPCCQNGQPQHPPVPCDAEQRNQDRERCEDAEDRCQRYRQHGEHRPRDDQRFEAAAWFLFWLRRLRWPVVKAHAPVSPPRARGPLRGETGAYAVPRRLAALGIAATAAGEASLCIMQHRATLGTADAGEHGSGAVGVPVEAVRAVGAVGAGVVAARQRVEQARLLQRQRWLLAGDETLLHVAEDVVDQRRRAGNGRVARHPRRLETGVLQFLGQAGEWHAVLQRHRGQQRDAVHQPADRRPLLGDLDEDLAWAAVFVQANGEVPFLLADGELVRDRLPLVGQALAPRSRLLGRDRHRGGAVLFLLGGVRQYLQRARAIAIDRDPLAALAIGEPVGGSYVLDGGAMGEVDRLADGVVRVPLEGRLDAHVPFGSDVVRGDENALHPRWHLVAVGQAAAPGQVVHQLLGVETLFLRVLGEVLVRLGQTRRFRRVVAVEIVLTRIGEREDRLDATRAVGDDAERARRRDRRARAVAVARPFGIARGVVVDAVFPLREDAAFLGQRLRGGVGVPLDEAHNLLGEGNRLLRVVGDAQLHAGVGEAHHAQTDAPDAARDVLDLRQRVAVHVDHVVEEANVRWDLARQPIVIEDVPRALAAGEVGEVDRAEVARVVRVKRLLAAWVRAFDRAKAGHRIRIAGVDAVDEDDTRVAVLPGVLHQHLEDGARVARPDDLARVRIDQLVLLAALNGAHERRGDRHRDVEVGARRHVGLAGDELLDVWVVDGEDAHIGAAPCAALLDRLGRGIEDFHERDRAAGHAGSAAHRRAFGPQAREGEASAAAGLMDQRRVFDRIEDLIERIFDR